MVAIAQQLSATATNGGEVLTLGNYEVKEVYDSFLSLHGRNSERTANEYKARVEEFFEMTLGKGVQFLTIEEIQSIKKKDIQTKYIDELIERGNSNNTIKVKLNSVRSFYNELQTNDLQVNPMIFKVKLSNDVTHHESMSFDELNQLFEFMKNEKDGFEKYLIVKTLFTTANRRTETFNMTWKDNFVVRRDVSTGSDIHVIRVLAKGKKWIEKPISDEYYEELQQLNHGQEKVFKIHPKTMERALDKFSKQLGKKITIHSLKATAITLGYQMTRDINLCKQLGGHASIVTTEIYLHEEKSYVNQLSYNMSRDIDENALESLSHRELLDLINDNQDIKMALLLRLG